MLVPRLNYLPCQTVAIENPAPTELILQELRFPDAHDQATLLHPGTDNDLEHISRSVNVPAKSTWQAYADSTPKSR